MSRVVQITVPSEATDGLVAELRSLEGIVGVQVQRRVSAAPPGDVVTVHSVTATVHPIMRVLLARGVGTTAGSSIATSEPISLVSNEHTAGLVREASDSTWEEMEQLIGKESNMTVNALLVMGIAGAFAAIGIATDALHLVIAAMLIAPGFEPLSRIGLGAATHGAAWRRGVADVVKGYLALVAGAALAAVFLAMAGKDLLGRDPGALDPGSLVAYWTDFTPASVAASALAAAGGALLIATNRSVLTSGVMVALSLIPAAALMSTGLAAARPDIAGQAALRWVIDAALVIALSWAVFAWKAARVHRRGTAF